MSLRNSCLSTLPVAVIGSESRVMTRSGVFWMGMPDEKLGERVCCYVVAKPGNEPPTKRREP